MSICLSPAVKARMAVRFVVDEGCISRVPYHEFPCLKIGYGFDVTSDVGLHSLLAAALIKPLANEWFDSR